MGLTPRVLQGETFFGCGQIRVETGDGGGGRMCGLQDLLALQQVETGHVLLQGPGAEAVAVPAVESSLLPVGCTRLRLLLPIVGGAQAAPL